VSWAYARYYGYHPLKYRFFLANYPIYVIIEAKSIADKFSQPFRKLSPKPVRKNGLFCYNIFTPKLPKFQLPKITPNREEKYPKFQ